MECGPEASSLQVSYLYFSSLRCGGKSLKGSAAYPAEFGNWVADHVASSVAWWNWIGGIVFFFGELVISSKMKSQDTFIQFMSG